MSKKFLEQLLQTKNKALFDISPNCEICLQPLGELSSETGVIECGIRLPCDHVFGSACIATWLRSNDSCPMCRRVLFTPHPSREPGSTADDEEADEMEVPSLADYCTTYTLELGLDTHLGRIALAMAEHLWDSAGWNVVHSRSCTAAVVLYVLSHLTGQPRSVDDVSNVSFVLAGHVFWTYREVYDHRRALFPITGNLLIRLGMISKQRFLATLPAPMVANGSEGDENGEGRITDTGEANSSIEHANVTQGHLGPAEELCEEFCAELDFDGYAEDIAWVISRDTSKMLAETSLSKVSLAVGIWMASHLVGKPRSAMEVSAVADVDSMCVRNAYEEVFPRRRQLVDLEVIQIMAVRNPERVYQLIPPLAWPGL